MSGQLGSVPALILPVLEPQTTLLSIDDCQVGQSIVSVSTDSTQLGGAGGTALAARGGTVFPIRSRTRLEKQPSKSRCRAFLGGG